MNPLIIFSGVLAGLGVFIVARQLIPPGPQLDVALARIHAAGSRDTELPAIESAMRRVAAAAPWLPMPSADLALLGQDREQWLVSKIACGLGGLLVVPLISAALIVSGTQLPWTVPAAISLALGTGMFFAPDLVTRVSAAYSCATQPSGALSKLTLNRVSLSPVESTIGPPRM